MASDPETPFTPYSLSPAYQSDSDSRLILSIRGLSVSRGAVPRGGQLISARILHTGTDATQSNYDTVPSPSNSDEEKSLHTYGEDSPVNRRFRSARRRRRSKGNSGGNSATTPPTTPSRTVRQRTERKYKEDDTEESGGSDTLRRSINHTKQPANESTILVQRSLFAVHYTRKGEREIRIYPVTLSTRREVQHSDIYPSVLGGSPTTVSGQPFEGAKSSPISFTAEKMAPGYSRSQNRRQNRTGLVDHDIYEGLPVKQWRRDYVTVAPPPSQESITQNDIWAVELPWGMPKDSHMLPQHSQDLLRAARSGRIYKRPAPVEEEEADPEIIPEKPEKKDDELKDKGFTAKAWKQISRQSDASEVEYLAKRRKGLVGVAASGSATVPTLIKATVKRTDAAGNEFVQDVVVPQGQHVEGEVLSQTVIPGTNPLSMAPTPPRRKIIPKKKKNKGPGRGRKKILVAPTSAPTAEGSGGIPAEPANPSVKVEGGDATMSNQNDDVEMGGASNAASDHEDGDEGDEDDPDETEDEEGSDSHASLSKITRPSSPAPASLPTMKPIPNFIDLDTDMSGTTPIAQSSTAASRDVLGAGFGGSTRQTDLETSALGTPPASSAPQISETQARKEDLSNLEHEMREEVAQSAPTDLPLAPPEPTIQEEIAAVQTLQEEEEEEEMLLDILSNTEIPETEPELPSMQSSNMLSVDQDTLAAESDLSEPPPELDSVIEEGEVEEVGHSTDQILEEDDDDFPDLLGGLEASLA